LYGAVVDRDLLARAYDRSAQGYDDRFRARQREKYRRTATLLVASAPPAGRSTTSTRRSPSPAIRPRMCAPLPRIALPAFDVLLLALAMPVLQRRGR